MRLLMINAAARHNCIRQAAEGTVIATQHTAATAAQRIASAAQCTTAKRTAAAQRTATTEGTAAAAVTASMSAGKQNARLGWCDPAHNILSRFL